jgi:hypothetical protein
MEPVNEFELEIAKLKQDRDRRENRFLEPIMSCSTRVPMCLSRRIGENIALFSVTKKETTI